MFYFSTNFLFKIGYAIFAFISIFSGLFTYLVNPGTIYSSKNNKHNETKIFCSYCSFYYPNFSKHMNHCHECGTCFLGHDHHCGVFGKCIAKNNYFFFVAFVACTFIGMLMTFASFCLLVSYASQESTKK